MARCEDAPCCGCCPTMYDVTAPEEDYDPEPSSRDPWLDCETDEDGEILADDYEDEDDEQPSELQENEDFAHDNDYFDNAFADRMECDSGDY